MEFCGTRTIDGHNRGVDTTLTSIRHGTVTYVSAKILMPWHAVRVGLPLDSNAESAVREVGTANFGLAGGRTGPPLWGRPHKLQHSLANHDRRKVRVGADAVGHD